MKGNPTAGIILLLLASLLIAMAATNSNRLRDAFHVFMGWNQSTIPKESTFDDARNVGDYRGGILG